MTAQGGVGASDWLLIHPQITQITQIKVLNKSEICMFERCTNLLTVYPVICVICG